MKQRQCSPEMNQALRKSRPYYTLMPYESLQAQLTNLEVITYDE